MNFFNKGFRSMLPITTGVIPFGAVMGTVASEAGISLFQSTTMNLIVFAGAAQLAAIDLMTKHTTGAVVVATGLIINLRFLLYSAALAPTVHKSSFLTRLVCAYCITDQNYAVMTANHRLFNTTTDAVRFYLGASLCMFLVWQLAVIAGFIFGNFAPTSWALDYAIPLSFVALVLPTLKNGKYVIVAGFSSLVSLWLSSLPFKIGLIITALLSVALGVLLSRRKRVS